LQAQAKFLRHRLSQEMRIRSVPELHFHHDASVETGLKMDQLINAARASDRKDSGDDDTESP
jgi:ribosome-binding factor A